MGASVVVNQLGTASAEASPWEQSSRADPLPIIWPLLGRHIAFHRRLVDLTDSVKAALLLSQSIYWTRRGRDIARTGGWFHKTTEQWTWETGLSAKEQRLARDVLKNLALISGSRWSSWATACRIGLPAFHTVSTGKTPPWWPSCWGRRWPTTARSRALAAAYMRG